MELVHFDTQAEEFITALGEGDVQTLQRIWNGSANDQRAKLIESLEGSNEAKQVSISAVQWLIKATKPVILTTNRPQAGVKLTTDDVINGWVDLFKK